MGYSTPVKLLYLMLMYVDNNSANVPTETIIYMAGNLADFITRAKSEDEIFRDYDFTGRSNFPFSY